MCITQERLKDLVMYSPDTGKFLWLHPPHPKFLPGEEAGTLDSRGRPTLCLDQKIYKQSRLVWLYHYGKFPEGEIDHINGDHADNRLINLRDVSHQENMKNTARTSRNTSGHSGVTWHKQRERWLSRITVNGKRKHLGFFKNKGVAIAARKTAEIMYGYHKNHGRDKQIKKNPLITREELRELAV